MTFLLIVTVSSMLLAAIMSVIAWRISAEEKRRSDARIAALAAEIHAPMAVQTTRAAASQSSRPRRAEIGVRGEPPRVAPVLVQRPVPSWEEDLDIRQPSNTRADGPDLFAQSASTSGWRIVPVAVLIVAAALALLVALGRGLPIRRGTTAGAAAAPAGRLPLPPVAPDAPPAPSAAAVPLELVALGHDRDGDRLTVRGIVRNPSSGSPVEPLSAVVSAFGADGGFLASGRAIIESTSLAPGRQSTFIVTVPGAAAVGRYRVSFRNGDRIVPHVDRREPPNASS